MLFEKSLFAIGYLPANTALNFVQLDPVATNERFCKVAAYPQEAHGRYVNDADMLQSSTAPLAIKLHREFEDHGDNELLYRESVVNADRSANVSGRNPVKLLSCKRICFIVVHNPSEAGKLPVNALFLRSNTMSEVMFPIDELRVPLNALSFIYRYCKAESWSIELGIVPPRLFDDSSRI